MLLSDRDIRAEVESGRVALDPFDPDRAPLWSSVTVEAETATMADALSTAACHMDRAALAALLDREPDLRAVTLVDAAGNVATLRRG